MLTRNSCPPGSIAAACAAALLLPLGIAIGEDHDARGPGRSVVSRDGQPLFALGMYERPRNDDEWRRWKEAGINLVKAGNREQLDESWKWGMSATVHAPMILADDDDGSKLVEFVNGLKDHPALEVWEAPDEAIWWAWRLERAQPPRFWGPHKEVAEERIARMDALVRGLTRGAALIREHDPGRRLWINEACQSSQASLARCAPSLDIIGFDYYPIPASDRRPMQYMGLYTDRFHKTAPRCDLWIVQQAFSWSSLPDREGPHLLPTLEQMRFMAWQSIAYGATGIFWWGSAYEGDRESLMANLLPVVSELSQLHPFLTSATIHSVRAVNEPNRYPWLLGGTAVARRHGERTMLVLINEDGTPADLIIQGLDWLDAGDLRPLTPVSSDLTSIEDGIITMMEGFEVRIYVSG